MSVTIELPPQEERIAFNLKRWEELLSDKSLLALNQRIETDRYGHVIMSPYPGGIHGAFESEFSYLFRTLLGGRSVVECPISTSDGVKLADAGWFSDERFAEVREHVAFPKAPEICVEVLSESNTEREMEEKRRLYFEAGCDEFWTCDREGILNFFLSDSGSAVEKSSICPEFPVRVTI